MNFKRLIIVRATISQWDARIKDSAAQQKVADEFGAGMDWGNASKHLIARDAVNSYARIAGEFRTWLHFNSLPYNKEGDRIMTVEHLEKVRAEGDAIKERWWEAVKVFWDNYHEFKKESEARKRLGKLWKASDYPTLDELKSKYSFTIRYYPLPDSSQVVAEMGKELSKQIKDQLDSENEELKSIFLKNIWDRLYDVIAHLVERLSKAENKFKNSLIGNIKDLIEILQTLNPDGDKRLEDAISRIEVMINGIDPESLRDNRKLRNKILDQAEDTLSFIDENRRRIHI